MAGTRTRNPGPVYSGEIDELGVWIDEIQEPEDFEGWGFQVIAEYDDEAPTREDALGIFEELDEARAVAIAYMADHEE